MNTLLIGAFRILRRVVVLSTITALAAMTLLGPETVTKSLGRGLSGGLKEALGTVTDFRFRARSFRAQDDRRRFAAALMKRDELLTALRHLRSSRDRLAALLENERERLGTIYEVDAIDRATH